ncbi:hypothetical protein [Gorillibacterium sp. CAU 1737]|uniref:hypothetical protein n=1 Tax=Gorillibacterium sp. CAU 1737 TaxID=3140362 RepID=UPI003261A4DA
MIHYSRDSWRSYQENLVTEQERFLMENHLETCDECLAVYLEALHPTSLQPVESGEGSIHLHSWTDSIMEAVQQLPAWEQLDSSVQNLTHIRTKERWYERKLFHYGIAAAMTLAILSTGILDEMNKYLHRQGPPLPVKQEISVSDQLMKRTNQLFDSIQPTKNGGTRRVP